MKKDKSPWIEVINNDQFPIQFNVGEVVRTTLRVAESKTECMLTLAFVGNEEIEKLNTEYRGYAQPTDVLSFPASEIDPESGLAYLGDIVISYPFVRLQASRLENDLSSELQLMIIHGTLHLLGYNHETDLEKQQMWEIQNTVLKQLNISLNQIPE